MRLQRPGRSINPGGQPAAAPGFRTACRDFYLGLDPKAQRSQTGLRILEDMASSRPQNHDEHEDRRFALKMLAAYGFDEPVRPVYAAVADVTPRINIIAAPARPLLDLKPDHE
jgi:hypothetical protein